MTLHESETARKPKGILFDFGDTLCTLDRFDVLAGNARCLELAKSPGATTPADVEAVAQRFNLIIKPMRESVWIEHRADAFQKLLYDYLGLEFSIPKDQLEQEFWNAAVTQTPEPGVRQTLSSLRSMPIKLAVVSNFSFSGKILREGLAEYDLLDFFSVVIASSEYGIRKPNPLIFELAAKMIGLRGSDIWFVGDKIAYDVVGANAAGMTSVWYNKNGEPQQGDDDSPDYVISDLRELPALARQ